MAAITDLSTASSVAAGDYLVISHSGTDQKVTANKLAIVGATNTFTAAQTFSAAVTTTGVLATENGINTPGVGAGFNSTFTLASGETILLLVRSYGAPNTVNAQHLSIISRQGTGTLISTIVSAAQITVTCETATTYQVRIVNSGSLDWALEYSILKIA